MSLCDLAGILGSTSVDEFLWEYFGRKVLHVRGEAGRFHALPAETLALEIERTLESSVEIRPQIGAAALGYGDRDLLILQTEGESEWKFFGNQTLRPANEASPTCELLTRAGDTLYIPRGWWRTGSCSGVQIVFAIDNPTGTSLLEWLLGLLKEQAPFRNPIPRFADPAARASHMADLRHMLTRTLRDPAVLETYRRRLHKTARPRNVAGEPWGSDLPYASRIVLSTPRKLPVRRASADTIFVVANGKRLTFPEDAAPLLHFLQDHAPATVGEFYSEFEGEFDREELEEFLNVLSRDAVIAFERPEGSGD